MCIRCVLLGGSPPCSYRPHHYDLIFLPVTTPGPGLAPGNPFYGEIAYSPRHAEFSQIARTLRFFTSIYFTSSPFLFFCAFFTTVSCGPRQSFFSLFFVGSVCHRTLWLILSFEPIAMFPLAVLHYICRVRPWRPSLQNLSQFD